MFFLFDSQVRGFVRGLFPKQCQLSLWVFLSDSKLKKKQCLLTLNFFLNFLYATSTLKITLTLFSVKLIFEFHLGSM